MKTMMLVDDNNIANFITQKFIELRLPDSNIVAFTNPVVAFENITSVSPHIIFLDLNMPEMDGWEFLEKMRDAGLEYPVAILTSSSNPLDIKKAEEYNNVVNFYIKPLQPDQFSRLVQSLP